MKIKTPLLLLLIPLFLICSCSTVEIEQRQEGWTIYEDGTFTLASGELQLTDCYPSMDGAPLHPLLLSIKRTAGGGRIVYQLDRGNITLELGKDSTGYFVATEIKGFGTSPDWLLPIAGGEVKGADRFYKQGFGFGGASGVYPIPEPRMRIESARLKENVWSYDSYLFTALIAPSEHTMVVSAFDHKHYQHRSTIYNRQHRIGLIDRHMDTDRVFFETGFAMEEVDLDQKRKVLPVIHIKTGDQPYEVLHAMAGEVAAVNDVGPLKPPRYYYCSWYEFNREYSYRILDGMLDSIRDMNPGPGIQAVQIDDGYSWYGDWLNTNERWPGGLEAAAKRIREAGYSPGIWVGPFMVSSNSFIYKEHKEWLLKDMNGDLVPEWRKPEEEVYILDASHPDAFAYLRKVFRTLREMGFTTFKTDFMDWGLQDSRKVQRYNPGRTSVEYYIDVVEMIREEIGEESYWLGCISPFQQMIGYVDGIRVSNDVHYNWSREGVGNMFREMYAGQFFNNVLWQNDPDVLYVRDYTMELTEEERLSIALYDGIMGGVINTSCRFHTLTGEQMELWHFLDPGEDHVVAELPGWGVYEDFVKVLRSYPEENAMALLLVNTSNDMMERSVDLAGLVDWEDIHVYDWGPGKAVFIGDLKEINVEVEPHASRLLYLSPEDVAPPMGMGLNGD